MTSNARMIPRLDDRGLRYIGPANTSFGRKVYLANPENRDYSSHRYVLWFGAYGSTYLMVWSDGLESAIEEAAAFLADHMPGHIMAMDSDEYRDLCKEACEEAGLPWPPTDHEDKRYHEAYQGAEADLTYTESGYLTSYEWGIIAEDPTRSDVEAICYPPGIDWAKYPEDGYRARRLCA